MCLPIVVPVAVRLLLAATLRLPLPFTCRQVRTRGAGGSAVPADSLPDYLRDTSRSFDSFRRDLKTFLVFLAYT